MSKDIIERSALGAVEIAFSKRVTHLEQNVQQREGENILDFEARCIGRAKDELTSALYTLMEKQGDQRLRFIELRLKRYTDGLRLAKERNDKASVTAVMQQQVHDLEQELSAYKGDT